MNRTVQYILFHFNLCSPLLSTTLEHWPLSVLIFTTLLGFHSWSEYCVHNCTILNISLIHLHYAWYTLSDLLLRSTRLSIRLHAATYNQRQSHLLRRISLRPCNHYPTNIDQGARKGALSINRVLQMILTGYLGYSRQLPFAALSLQPTKFIFCSNASTLASGAFHQMFQAISRRKRVHVSLSSF